MNRQCGLCYIKNCKCKCFYSILEILSGKSILSCSEYYKMNKVMKVKK